MDISIKKILKNTLIYIAIGAGLYYLYSPYNTHHKNATGTSSQFVYQAF